MAQCILLAAAGSARSSRRDRPFLGPAGPAGRLAVDAVTVDACEATAQAREHFVADRSGLRRDAVYGVTLTLGLGGVTAEVLSDTVTLVWPVTEAEVLGAMRRLRLWPLLDGYRGRPKADTGAVAAMALALGVNFRRKGADFF